MVINQFDFEQHFLCHAEKIRIILAAAQIQERDHVVELGAGIGSVARYIPSCRLLSLVELDVQLAALLRLTFPDACVIQQDALMVLPALKPDVLLSNLPASLSFNLLSSLRQYQPRVSLVAVAEDFDEKPFMHDFQIRTVCYLNKQDFDPPQPFVSKVLMIS